MSEIHLPHDHGGDAPLAAIQEKLQKTEAFQKTAALFQQLGDPTRLAQVLLNFAGNALKFTAAGAVTLRCRALDGCATHQLYRFEVADTGIGIPEEDRLNVFSRFYRVDKARSREAGGSGLGLSIVHDAVVLHGGTITVGQNKPRGTKFTVSFPRPTPEETGI